VHKVAAAAGADGREPAVDAPEAPAAAPWGARHPRPTMPRLLLKTATRILRIFLATEAART
jgi:hypothetical protein